MRPNSPLVASKGKNIVVTEVHQADAYYDRQTLGNVLCLLGKPFKLFNVARFPPIEGYETGRLIDARGREYYVNAVKTKFMTDYQRARFVAKLLKQYGDNNETLRSN